MKIELQHITKYYGKHPALQDISATLREGVYGLLGPNGAGKTTLINILIGILARDGGQILLDGKEISAMGNEYFDLVGYMPQYPQFYSNFTVWEFLRYMCRMKGVQKERERIGEVLAFVNLTQHQGKHIGSLSGGMRQRLGIAQAILNEPKLLILDEPTAGLDPGERIRFRNLISQLAGGRIILLATHIVSDVECIAKEILLLRQGNLVVQGLPADLERGLSGKVWEVSVPEERVAEFVENRCVGNMRQTEDGYVLRVMDDRQPEENARMVLPGLEDVFLYTFFYQKGGRP